MTIGEALRIERKNLGLTQTKMVEGIMKKSHYSKIENDQQSITANNLFKILFLHNIDIEMFMQNISTNFLSNQRKIISKLEVEMKEAFNANNGEKIEKILKELLKIAPNSALTYRTIIAYKRYQNPSFKIDNDLKTKIIKLFTKSDNWTTNVDAIRLLANTMMIFSKKQLDFFVEKLMRKYLKLNDISERWQERIAIVANNYLYHCLFDEYKGQKINLCIKYLNKLPAVPHMMFYRQVGVFYQCLIRGNIEKAMLIKKRLTDLGYDKWVEDWKVS